MNTSDRNSFGLGHAKSTDSPSNNRALLAKYLRGLPSLDFSSKGYLNICQRWGLTTDELAKSIAEIQRSHPAAPKMINAGPTTKAMEGLSDAR